MQPGGELWRKDALYEIMDGKSDSIVRMLEQDPELKKWRCKQAGDECESCAQNAAVDIALRNFSAMLRFLARKFEHRRAAAKPPDDKTILPYPRRVRAARNCARCRRHSTPTTAT